jgi:hypothetical protein
MRVPDAPRSPSTAQGSACLPGQFGPGSQGKLAASTLPFGRVGYCSGADPAAKSIIPPRRNVTVVRAFSWAVTSYNLDQCLASAVYCIFGDAGGQAREETLSTTILCSTLNNSAVTSRAQLPFLLPPQSSYVFMLNALHRHVLSPTGAVT